MISQQRQMGITPVVLTSPSHDSFEESCEILQGVQHHRSKWPVFYFLPQPRFIPGLRHEAYITALAKRIVQVARECEADLLHAHSPALNGLATQRAARQLKKPWLYELRYYEQDAAVDSGQTTYYSLRYSLARWMEERALKQADLAITTSTSMQKELLARGFSSRKLLEVPEGVDTRMFQPRQPDGELVERHQLEGKTVIGFIGSFYRYEGLDRLMTVMNHLLRERRDIKLILAGSGEVESQLRARVPREWNDYFIFTGRIEQEEILRYYSVIDICVYPRLSTRMTELTTPIRPLEAMSMERAIIGSNVGGIAELIRHNKTGFVVETDDRVTLGATISYLVNNPHERKEVGKRARIQMVKQRDWATIALKYADIYQRVLSVKTARLLTGIQAPETEKSTWQEGQPSESQTKI
ncbi:MAG TPA: glycosyltransferase [Blastocatellia bacterium]|nr:glycosyltransferase [Blastocatellia bacterium]